ncbi:uncharacterized protein [Diabrotica undecimpunctata]|uniref:uncharacterized protein n=1 Tax=Diabrotica undecimpunctata TaxID=50387 RepID=UPI003B63533D
MDIFKSRTNRIMLAIANKKTNQARKGCNQNVEANNATICTKPKALEKNMAEVINNEKTLCDVTNLFSSYDEKPFQKFLSSDVDDEMLLLDIPEITDMMKMNSDQILPESNLRDEVLNNFCTPIEENVTLEFENNILSSSEVIAENLIMEIQNESEVENHSKYIPQHDEDVILLPSKSNNLSDVNKKNIIAEVQNGDEFEDDPDYVLESDQESSTFSEKDADNERETAQEAEQNKDDPLEKRRMKRHLVNKENWIENKKKIKREKGEAYLGKRKINGRWDYNIEREERRLKEFCNCKLSKKNTVIKCTTFSEEDRKAIFTKFWSNMNLSERKMYVSFLVKPTAIKRHRNRQNSTTSRRKESMLYYMKKEGQLIRVCKQMFLNTHCLKEDMVLDWLRKEATSQTKTDDNNSNEITMHTARYKDMKENLRQFFSELSKVESHYCRSSSDKLYLEPNWKSNFIRISILYELVSRKTNGFIINCFIFPRV